MPGPLVRESKSEVSMIKSEVAIIGAGLTGLYLHYLLSKQGISSVLIEARTRIGGRILSLKSDKAPPLEMGATWLDRSHLYLIRLLEELNLEIYPQKMDGRAFYEPDPRFPFQLVDLPSQGGSSYRIVGGTTAIIYTLAEQVDPVNTYLDNQVKLIRKVKEGMFVEASSQEFLVDKVVSTLPPHLFSKSIDVEPKLPEELTLIQSETHTWMGESIRMAIAYSKPFWRDSKLSGTVFSNAGPVVELYDHSDFSDDAFALSGFINNEFRRLSKEERFELILAQLEKYYGSTVRDYISYHECDWQNEQFTFTSYDSYMAPHRNNGHPLYRQSYLEGRLYLAGTETAAKNPGYMEGAVYSAWDVYRQLISPTSKGR